MESEEEDEEDRQESATSSEELMTTVRQLQARLEDMQTCSELIAKHGAGLQRLLGELEQPDDAQGKSKAVGERATLFRIASNAMINVMLRAWFFFASVTVRFFFLGVFGISDRRADAGSQVDTDAAARAGAAAAAGGDGRTAGAAAFAAGDRRVRSRSREDRRQRYGYI